MRRLWVVGAAAIALAMSVSVAHAQTTTTAPCGSGTNTPCGFDLVQDLGNKREGETFTIANNSGFMPAAAGTKSFNGTPTGGFPFPANGTPVSTVTIVDDGVGTPTALGRVRPLLGAVGLNLAQANRTPRVRVDGVLYNANALGVRNSIVIQGQAADTGQGRWTNYFTIVVDGGNVGGSGLGRTGTMIARWSMLGAALLAVGALLVMASRRRRTA